MEKSCPSRGVMRSVKHVYTVSISGDMWWLFGERSGRNFRGAGHNAHQARP